MAASPSDPVDEAGSHGRIKKRFTEKVLSGGVAEKRRQSSGKPTLISFRKTIAMSRRYC